MTPHALIRRVLPVLALATLAACETEASEDVNQDRIYGAYELHYDATRDVTVARAAFHFGGPTGTLLELSEGATVTFNGQALPRVKEGLTGRVYYERTYGERVSTGTFEYVDLDGRDFENDVTLRAIGFPATVGPIDNDASYTLPFTGAALATGEQVNVLLYRVSANAGLGLFRQDAAGAQDVVMDRGQLQNVPPGPVTLRMERVSSRAAGQATSVGGRTVGRYTAVDRAAEVVD